MAETIIYVKFHYTVHTQQDLPGWICAHKSHTCRVWFQSECGRAARDKTSWRSTWSRWDTCRAWDLACGSAGSGSACPTSCWKSETHIHTHIYIYIYTHTHTHTRWEHFHSTGTACLIWCWKSETHIHTHTHGGNASRAQVQHVWSGVESLKHTHTHTHTPVSYTHLRAHETG